MKVLAAVPLESKRIPCEFIYLLDLKNAILKDWKDSDSSPLQKWEDLKKTIENSVRYLTSSYLTHILDLQKRNSRHQSYLWHRIHIHLSKIRCQCFYWSESLVEISILRSSKNWFHFSCILCNLEKDECVSQSIPRNVVTSILWKLRKCNNWSLKLTNMTRKTQMAFKTPLSQRKITRKLSLANISNNLKMNSWDHFKILYEMSTDNNFKQIKENKSQLTFKNLL